MTLLLLRPPFVGRRVVLLAILFVISLKLFIRCEEYLKVVILTFR